MLLHVIWGLVDELAHECPTFSVTGMMLHCDDRVSAYVKQSRFRWRGDAWEADVHVSRIGSTPQSMSGTFRLHPEVWLNWIDRSLNPRAEAARQLRAVMQARESTTDLGVITLHP